MSKQSQHQEIQRNNAKVKRFMLWAAILTVLLIGLMYSIYA